MNFYEKPLRDLSEKEWEQICLRCGKCCMCKYSDENVIHFSNYMCKFFDLQKGLCSCYDNRLIKAEGGCKKIDMDLLENHLELLPPSCAYRSLYEGRGLPPYHPLLTGKPNSAIKARQTVRSLPVVPEDAKDNALLLLLKKVQQKPLNRHQIEQELKKIDDKYSLKWLESYPFPTK